jgi:hypothetical protein
VSAAPLASGAAAGVGSGVGAGAAARALAPENLDLLENRYSCSTLFLQPHLSTPAAAAVTPSLSYFDTTTTGAFAAHALKFSFVVTFFSKSVYSRDTKCPIAMTNK